MKRVLIASMQHESNSFNPITAGADDFVVYRGDEIYRHLGANNPVAGIVDVLREQDFAIVPAVFISAVPNGEVDRDFYLKMKAELLEKARQEEEKMPLDGICLALHGSMRVRDFGEAEGPLLEELRSLFPGLPIFATLDTHTTMTAKMHANCDGFVAYKCAPHTDRYETGRHAAEMCVRALSENISTVSAWVRVPILIAGEQSSSTVEPMISLIREAKASEAKEDVLAASYLMGFPWSDNADSSCGVLVVANTAATARREALRLAELLWKTRNDFCFQTETYSEEEAIETAFRAVLAGEATPVYLSDSGDNPTAGSTSDCTAFLARLMNDPRSSALPSPVLFGGIYDPAACLACRGRVGQTIELSFGAAFDSLNSEPIRTRGTVKAYVEKWDGFGLPSDIALFHSQGVDIVLAEEHIGYTMPELFRALGREPAEAEIVVCKLGYLTAAQSAVARRSIMALSGGSTNEDLRSLPYRRLTRPVFPLEDDFRFVPEESCILNRRREVV